MRPWRTIVDGCGQTVGCRPLTHHLLRLPPGDPNDYAWYNDLALYYTKGGALHMVITDRWKLSDPNDPASFDAYEKLSAREFAYDNPQARWLDRDVSTSTYAPGAGAQHWTDSLGVVPYLDFECTPPVDPNDPNELPLVSGVTRYLGASAQQKLDDEGEPLETRYYHGDLIDSTCLTTDEAGAQNSGGGVVSTVAYTAFGEVIAANGTAVNSTPGSGFPRYQYAGAFRYESGLITLDGVNDNLASIAMQHLGARWYGPAIGRFVQRDPLGIISGPNTYKYCNDEPIWSVDPSGLLALPIPWSWPTFASDVTKGTIEGGLAGAGLGTAVEPGGGTIVGTGVGGGLGGAVAAAGYIGWWGGANICLMAVDIGKADSQLIDSQKANRRQRESRPDVFGPDGKPRRFSGPQLRGVE